MTQFKQRVLEAVSGIPRGETRTYSEIAAIAGNPRAYRAVGNIMKSNDNPRVPCHRVVRSDGTLGGYNRKGGIVAKRMKLQREGALPCGR